MSPEAYVEMAQQQKVHWWFQGRRSILQGFLQRLRLPAQSRALEIGSGTGANLSLLAEFADKVVGVEMSADAIAFAKTHLRDSAAPRLDRIDMIQGMCPQALGDMRGRFDLVCMFDVLEHIPDESGSLAAARDCLKTGGKLFITVPAYQWLWSPHDEVLHHQRRYTRARIVAACEAQGLVVEQATYFNTILLPLAVAARWADRLLKRKASSGTGVPSAGVNGLLKNLFASERHALALGALPFGLSIAVVATPRAPAPTAAGA